MSAVLIDRNARTAILIKEGRKHTHLVALQEGELVVRPFSDDEMRDRGFRALEGYPIKKAVRKYLKHSGGVSKAARQALKEVAA